MSSSVDRYVVGNISGGVGECHHRWTGMLLGT